MTIRETWFLFGMSFGSLLTGLIFYAIPHVIYRNK